MIELNQIQIDVNRDIERDYPDRNINPMLRAMYYTGLGEEAGEVLGLFKRSIRHATNDRLKDIKAELINEVGDVLWYLAAICNCEGIKLEDAWQITCEKIAKRSEEGYYDREY